MVPRSQLGEPGGVKTSWRAGWGTRRPGLQGLRGSLSAALEGLKPGRVGPSEFEVPTKQPSIDTSAGSLEQRSEDDGEEIQPLTGQHSHRAGVQLQLPSVPTLFPAKEQALTALLGSGQLLTLKKKKKKQKALLTCLRGLFTTCLSADSLSQAYLNVTF